MALLFFCAFILFASRIHVCSGLTCLRAFGFPSLYLKAMWAGVDAGNIDSNPVKNFNRPVQVLFLFIIIICSYFNLNLFIGGAWSQNGFHACSGREKSVAVQMASMHALG